MGGCESNSRDRSSSPSTFHLFEILECARSPWFTWRNFMKAGAVASIIGAIFGVTAVTCG